MYGHLVTGITGPISCWWGAWSFLRYLVAVNFHCYRDCMLFNDCARFIVTQSTASTSSLQRRFSIGYNKAGKIMDQMEAAGIVGAAQGAKPRAVLMDAVTLESIL